METVYCRPMPSTHGADAEQSVEWRLEADRTLECYSSGRLVLVHIFGMLVMAY